MSFYQILGKPSPYRHKSIALGVIQKDMGDWKIGSNARGPDIDIRIISNFSKIYQVPRMRWWRRWIQKLGIL